MKFGALSPAAMLAITSCVAPGRRAWETSFAPAKSSIFASSTPRTAPGVTAQMDRED